MFLEPAFKQGQKKQCTISPKQKTSFRWRTKTDLANVFQVLGEIIIHGSQELVVSFLYLRQLVETNTQRPHVVWTGVCKLWKFKQHLLGILSFALPETSIAPENRVSEKETSIPTIFFQVPC